jgi:hypothetical protein
VKGLSPDGSKLVNEIWAAVGNYGLGTAADTGATSSPGGGHTGGAIVGMDYRQTPYDSASSPSFVWTYQQSGVTKQVTSVIDGGAAVPLSGPTYLAVLSSTDPVQLLICDSSAVYVTEGDKANVLWKLTGEQYSKLTRKITVRKPDESVLDTPTLAVAPIPFTPHMAQMLPNNRILIVNSYAGQMENSLKSKFVGEIFETDCQLKPSKPSTQIFWYTPDINFYPATITDVPPLGIGEYVQKLFNAPNLDQPTWVQRIK